MVFHVFENSGPSREIYVDFDSVTTVNEGSTKNCKIKQYPVLLSDVGIYPLMNSDSSRLSFIMGGSGGHNLVNVGPAAVHIPVPVLKYI